MDQSTIIVDAMSTGHADNPTPARHRGLASVLLRRWKTVVFVTFVSAAVACPAAWFGTEPKYEVSVSVHVAPVVRPILKSDMDTDISRQYREFMATQCGLIGSPGVVALALEDPEIASLELVRSLTDPVPELAARITAEQVRATQLIQVKLTGRNGSDCEKVLNKVVESYLARHERENEKWAKNVLSSLRDEEVELGKRISEGSEELRELSTSNATEVSEVSIDTRVAELGSQRTLARQQIALIDAKLMTLNVQGASKQPNFSDLAKFQEFLQLDSEWSQLEEDLRASLTALSALSAQGKGAAHPAVVVANDRLAESRKARDERAALLLPEFHNVQRNLLEEQRLDAVTMEKVVANELAELLPSRGELMRQTLAVQDVRFEQDRLDKARVQIRQKIWNVELEQHRAARITIKSAAIAPLLPNIDKRPKYVAAALLLSLMLGAAAGLVREQFDTKIRDPEEMSRQLSFPILGSVGELTNGRGVPVLPSASTPYSSRPIYRIATTLLAVSPKSRCRSQLITSPSSGDGKSNLARDLARTLAATNRRVLLVDCDNAVQGLTEALDMVGRVGLRELLAGTATEEQVRHDGEVEGLSVVPAGAVDAEFGTFLISRRGQATLKALFRDYDQVVIDGPPVLGSADALTMAAVVDEIILVLRVSKSTRAEISATRRHLETAGGNIVGVVLTGVREKDMTHYYGAATTA